MNTDMNKAERLAVAGQVAPTLREHGERARSRRVARVNERGDIVGYTTLAEVQRAQLARAKIELDVMGGGVRPAFVVCHACGSVVRATLTGHPRPRLHGCKRGRPTTVACSSCGATVPATRTGPPRPRAHRCKHNVCKDCGGEVRADKKRNVGIRCAACAGLRKPKEHCACGAELRGTTLVRRRKGFDVSCQKCSRSRRNPTEKCRTCGGRLGRTTAGKQRKGEVVYCRPCADRRRREE